MTSETVRVLLSEGRLDDAGAKLLYAVVRDTAFRHRYPPPEGEQVWSADAIHTVAHDFLTGTRSTQRLVQLAAQSGTAQQFEALLRTAVLNYFRDTARKTVIGRQILRLQDVASSDARFRVNGPTVTLAASPEDAASFSGDESQLVHCIASFRPESRRWRPDTKREGPLANRDETATLIETILRAAGGTCTFTTLARILALRFDLTPTPTTVEVDVLDPISHDAYTAVEVADQVDQILAQLTERERRVLPLLDSSSRDIASTIGLGRTTVAKTQVKLRSLLNELIPDVDATDIANALLDRLEQAEQGAGHLRPGPSSSTYDTESANQEGTT